MSKHWLAEPRWDEKSVPTLERYELYFSHCIMVYVLLKHNPWRIQTLYPIRLRIVAARMLCLKQMYCVATESWKASIKENVDAFNHQIPFIDWVLFDYLRIQVLGAVFYQLAAAALKTTFNWFLLNSKSAASKNKLLFTTPSVLRLRIILTQNFNNMAHIHLHHSNHNTQLIAIWTYHFLIFAAKTSVIYVVAGYCFQSYMLIFY